MDFYFCWNARWAWEQAYADAWAQGNAFSVVLTRCVHE